MQAAGIVGVQPSDLFTIEDLFELNNEIKVRFLLSARHSFRALQSAASERHARRHCEHRRCARPFASRLPTSAPGSDPRLLHLPWVSNGLTLAAVIALRPCRLGSAAASVLAGGV